MARRRNGLTELTSAERCDLTSKWSLFGPSTFESPEDRLAAWKRHGAALMADYRGTGRRPLAWWQYDSTRGERPHCNDELAELVREGEATEAERRRWELKQVVD